MLDLSADFQGALHNVNAGTDFPNRLRPMSGISQAFSDIAEEGR